MATKQTSKQKRREKKNFLLRKERKMATIRYKTENGFYFEKMLFDDYIDILTNDIIKRPHFNKGFIICFLFYLALRFDRKKYLFSFNRTLQILEKLNKNEKFINRINNSLYNIGLVFE